MSIWHRVVNIFRRERVNRELEEEMRLHIEEAVEQGRTEAEARRAFGNRLRIEEASRDFRFVPWMESLAADVTFGWRQLRKNRAVSIAAVLSLGLAIGAVTAAFRLIDAMLLRPLPVVAPEELYVVTTSFVDEKTGEVREADSFNYPLFRDMRDLVKKEAELIGIAYADRTDLTYGADSDMEKAVVQNVSGTMFGAFGLQPAAGRLLTADDDRTPGAHPVAVLSHHYWLRRFGSDPEAIGKTFRLGADTYEIIGVCQEGYTGTEPGTMTELFVPMMMNKRAIPKAGWHWFRTWARVRAGADMNQIREKLQVHFTNQRREQMKSWPANMPRHIVENHLSSRVQLRSSAAGFSAMQKDLREPLLVLSAVVVLVLLIACANVANLFMAQAAARAREMALRVSIGAGRGRLVQLVLMESAMVAIAASILGAAFAWWSAPFVVSMVNPKDNPMQLAMPADWRVLGFTVALATLVTLLFGLAPALRASAIKPATALKGGSNPHEKRRLMNALVAAQVAFCFLVHFTAGLFVATFERLSNQPVGFEPRNVLLLKTVVKNAERPPEIWEQIAQELRTVPGVESVSFSGWEPMGGSSWQSGIRLNGQMQDDTIYFLEVSSQFFATMKLPLRAGREFREGERRPRPGVAIVNDALARRFFDGQNPLGRFIETSETKDQWPRQEIVGLAGDARYRNMREEIRPTVYVPYGPARGNTTFEVRTAGDPLALATRLRQEVPRLHPEFRVSNIQTQEEVIAKHTLKERLLATLSLFFAAVALVLASVGLYGVLNYSVIRRTREIGIRMALGARPANVVSRVTGEVFGMLALGSAIGLVAGLLCERYVQSLLFGVKATDATMVAIPLLTLLAAAALAAFPPAVRAVRVDPAQALRAE